MTTSVQFDSDDEEFYGDMGSIGSTKFDTLLTGSQRNNGSIPRGFTMLATGNQGAGMDLFGKQEYSADIYCRESKRNSQPVQEIRLANGHHGPHHG